MVLYTFAGLCVEMEPRFSLTSSRLEAYRCMDACAPDMTLRGEGDAFAEHAALARSFYTQLLSFDGFLLHGSAIEYHGKAVVFSAPSGTGKSTHAAYWCDNLGASIINDDKPALRVMNGIFHACGTPFSGKHDRSRPVNIPLAAIVFLQQSNVNSVSALSTADAVALLLSQTLRPQHTADVESLLALLDRLLLSVPLYTAGVRNEAAAALFVREHLDI